jgi:hypothetical protein
MPSEAGYAELHRLFDYLREQGLIGGKDGVSITVLDADDLLDKPEAAIRAFCEDMGIPYSQDMLKWDDEENQQQVSDAFAKWNGWHDDAINSKGLTARTHPKVCDTLRMITPCVPISNQARTQKSVSEESENEEWRQKYGDEVQKTMRACVDENTPYYEYLKSFAMKF